MMASDETLLQDNEATAMSEAAAQICSKFPPETTAYVVLGESGRPVLSFVKRLHPQAAVLSLPISNIKEDVQSLKNGYRSILEDKETEGAKNLLKYCDLFIPASKLKGRSKVLVVDFVKDGWALVVGRYIVEEYYKWKGVSVTVQMLNLNTTLPQTPEIMNELQEVSILDASKSDVLAPLTGGLSGQTYKQDKHIRKYKKIPLGQIQSGLVFTVYTGKGFKDVDLSDVKAARASIARAGDNDYGNYKKLKDAIKESK